MSSELAETELLLKVATIQNAKLENRITHLLSNIETLEENNRQQAEYVDGVIDKLNEVMMDVTGLYDSFVLANRLMLDVINRQKMPSTTDIKMQGEVENHLKWMVDTFEELLEKHTDK